MRQKLRRALILFVILFIVDQAIKYGFVFQNLGFESSCISLVLAYNYGVAFSMFSFLQEYLKYIQLTIILGMIIYLYYEKEVFTKYSLPISMLLAGGLSNVLDRFTYGAVVDYVYWHCGFDFAIFNFADVIIDCAVALIIFHEIKEYRQEKAKLKK